MTQEKIKRIQLIYGVIVSVLILSVGIGLICSCLDIYHSGDKPYSGASIASRWVNIAPIVWLCVAAVGGGILLCAFLPAESKRPKAVRDDKHTLRRLRAKAGTLTGDDLVVIQTEHKRNKCLRIVTACLWMICVAVPLIYFLDLSHFPAENLNQEVAKAVIIAFAAALVMLILSLIFSIWEQASIRRQIAVYKKVIASGKLQPQDSPACVAAAKNDITLRIARCAILAAAICFIILGWFNGGVEDVLGKAIRICTECIGLG